MSESLSLNEARSLFIARQLLQNTGNTSRDKNGLYRIIDRLGYVQIDTISVVERSHHLILWARMPHYKKNMLDELVSDRKIFEYWSHAAAYLPMKDYRYSLIRKKHYSEKYKTWGRANKKITKHVHDRIKNEGPLQSKDFEDNKSKTSGWWDWKPSKDALDFLFHQGKLMIARRIGFQKVYDLTENILPSGTDTTYPSEKEFYKHLIDNSIKANGLVSFREITYQRRHDKKVLDKLIKELLEEEKIIRVNIRGIEGNNYFTTVDTLELINKNKSNQGVYILSPFDNLVIQRKRLKEFFGFDYTIECYVPESKRKFGYFSMPVLYGDKFIGRMDAKADRANKTFLIKKIHWEEKSKLNNKLSEKFERKLAALAKFTGCEKTDGLNIK